MPCMEVRAVHGSAHCAWKYDVHASAMCMQVCAMHASARCACKCAMYEIAHGSVPCTKSATCMEVRLMEVRKMEDVRCHGAMHVPTLTGTATPTRFSTLLICTFKHEKQGKMSMGIRPSCRGVSLRCSKLSICSDSAVQRRIQPGQKGNLSATTATKTRQHTR